MLYWGTAKVADSCTSAAVRDKGPGGAFCLWTTRANFLHCRHFAELLQAEDKGSNAPGGPRRCTGFIQVLKDVHD